MGRNADLRRSYVRVLIGNMSVNDNKIVVGDSIVVLEAAASNGDLSAGATVLRV